MRLLFVVIWDLSLAQGVKPPRHPCFSKMNGLGSMKLTQNSSVITVLILSCRAEFFPLSKLA